MDYDHEIIADFLGEYDDAQIEIEKTLRLWDVSDHCPQTINSIFRVIHSIKGNFTMMYLAHISETIHVLEDILSQLRDKQRQLIPGFTLLISATLEQCKEFAKQIFSGSNKDKEIKSLTYALIDLSNCSNNDFASALHFGLQTIDGIGEYGNDYPSERIFDFLQKVELERSCNPIAYLHNSNIKVQLDFFKNTITQIEKFFPYWKNRSASILELASYMNSLLNHPVTPIQLEAAVYMHDIGMSYLPPQTFYSTETLTQRDRELMYSHCNMGSQWLKHIPGWDEAALIVEQHHERFDGKGYPSELPSSQICDGAKILAIGDTFFSIISNNKGGNSKQSIMLALTEIDQGAGHQFDPEWIKVFDQAAEMIYL